MDARSIKTWLGLGTMVAAAIAGTIAFFSHYATASQVESIQSMVTNHESILSAIRTSLDDNKEDHKQMIDEMRQIKDQVFQINQNRR